MAKRSDADAPERGSRRTNENGPADERGGILSRRGSRDREDDPDRVGREARGVGEERGPGDGRNGHSSAARDGRSSRLSGARAAMLARQQVEELLGLPVETISGLARHPDGFTVTLEVVEIERVPRTTDILGTYRVELTPEGELDGYERVHRYYRNQADGE
jgi:hypothetical protein